MTDGDCLCNRPPGVSFLEVRGQRVGIAGGESLFRAWLHSGREPSDLSAAEILAGLRERNYVSRSAEHEYAEAMRTAYGVWRARSARTEPEVQQQANAQG